MTLFQATVSAVVPTYGFGQGQDSGVLLPRPANCQVQRPGHYPEQVGNLFPLVQTLRVAT